MANEVAPIKQRYYHDHLPPLKPITERSIDEKSVVQRQPNLQASSLLPHFAANMPGPRTSLEANTVISSTTNPESPPPSMTAVSYIRQDVDRIPQRNHASSISSTQSTALPLLPTVNRGRKASLYKHVQSKIDTGLPRIESTTRPEPDTYQLGPTRQVNWTVMKQELEQDPQLRAQAKRLQFDAGVTYKKQLTDLVNLIRNKVKTRLTSLMGNANERYKIVVHVTVFQASAAGLHVSSRCLWNPQTDNSITIKMQGVDCDVLMVIFLCYTDLGGV